MGVKRRGTPSSWGWGWQSGSFAGGRLGYPLEQLKGVEGVNQVKECGAKWMFSPGEEIIHEKS